jgi:hypothetical protein
MNRRLISWLITGAVVVLCAVAVSMHLTDTVAGHDQAATGFAAEQFTPTAWSSGRVARTQSVEGITIALTAAPDQFGAYTFIIAIRDAKGAPLQGATVDMVLTMPDMQMDPLRIHAPPIGAAVPGAYSAQGVLAVGRWQAVVQVLARSTTHAVQAAFGFSVA